jgi:tetratricopeptide (TPR) repeat protein
MAHHGMGLHTETPPDALPPAQQLTGIGNVSIRITATAEAQRWFDQGLNLLEDFWDYESARAFEQSVRVDPKCAMCYWGLYQAESFYHSTAQDYAAPALARAVSLTHGASRAERLYIQASAEHDRVLHSGKFDFTGEVQLWRKLVKKSPHDSEAKLFLAQALLDGFTPDGQPRAGEKEGLALMQAILTDEPENSAANHRWIHALEDGHPEQALHSASILAQLAPASGHMVHMPGHVYYLLGDYARAETAFSDSMQLDERYMREQNVEPDNNWNYVHNLMYAVANLLEEGKLKEASALSAKLTVARGDLDTTLYLFSPRDAISRLDPHLPVALRTADWSQVRELSMASDPLEQQPNLRFLKSALGEFATGMQAAESRNLAQAEDASRRLDAQLWDLSEELKGGVRAPAVAAAAGNAIAAAIPMRSDAFAQPLISSLAVMSLELRGSLRILEGAAADGGKLFAQAAQEEKALGYREPPHYIRPVAESQGAVLMAVGDWIGAAAAYQAALVERPRSGFALYGIARCSEARGDTAAAIRAYQQFLDAWQNGDPELPQIVHARAYIAGNGVAKSKLAT